MPYYNMKDYVHDGFQRSHLKHKKYNAILIHKKTKRITRVPFGAVKVNGAPYEQYKDSTGLKLFSKYDHYDKKRRSNYKSRHNGFIKPGYYSPGYFAMRYLW